MTLYTRESLSPSRSVATPACGTALHVVLIALQRHGILAHAACISHDGSHSSVLSQKCQSHFVCSRSTVAKLLTRQEAAMLWLYLVTLGNRPMILIPAHSYRVRSSPCHLVS